MNQAGVNQAVIDASIASMVGEPANNRATADGGPIGPSASPSEVTPHSATATKDAPFARGSEDEQYQQQIDRLEGEIVDAQRGFYGARAAERDAYRSGRASDARHFEAEEQRFLGLARARRADLERVRFRASQTVEAYRRAHAPKAG